MALIPSAEKIQRRAPSGATGVAGYDGGNAASGLGEISAGLGKMVQRKTDFETSKADLDFAVLKNKLEKSAEQDDDYSTLDDRYTSEVSNKLGELALSIGDTRARGEFVARHKLNIENSRKRIQGIARNKEVDNERAGVNERLNALSEMVQTGTAEQVSESMASMGNLLNTAQKLGYYSEVDTGKIKEAWKTKAATDRLTVMEPEEQLEALQKPWAENLPLVTRTKFAKQAKVATRKKQAISMVDGFLDEEIDEEQARDKMAKIKDTALRKEVESRWDYAYGRNRKAEIEEQWQHRDSYAYDILNGKKKVEDIPPEEWEAMDSDTKMYLDKMQADSVKTTPRKSDPNTVLMISELAAKEKYESIINLVKDPNSALSSADRIKYGQIAINGSMPIEIDDDLTNTQAIKSALASAEITDKKAKDKILHSVGEWQRRYIETHNKKPDSKAIDEFIDEQFLKVKTDDGFFYDSESYLYEITEDDWEDAKGAMKDEDPELGNKVIEYFGSSKPSKAEVIRTFDDFKEAKARKNKKLEAEQEAKESKEDAIASAKKSKERQDIWDRFFKEFESPEESKPVVPEDIEPIAASPADELKLSDKDVKKILAEQSVGVQAHYKTLDAEGKARLINQIKQLNR